jgi:hypothetical protein
MQGGVAGEKSEDLRGSEPLEDDVADEDEQDEED